MKKIYSLLATALCAASAMAQVSVDDLAGKYVLVGDEPTYYIEDHGFDPSNIVILDRTGAKTFALDNFYYDMTDYDGNQITLAGTFYDQGEWANYPTVQNIQFTYDATNVFFYNYAAESGDTEWLVPFYNSFRLLTQKDADGTPNLYLWPNNSILLTYYANESWDNKALEFVNKGAWNAETNPVGSLHLRRLPQYQTVSKRGLAGEYTVKGKDGDGNEVSYKVTIELDGTDYIMTGLFGASAPALTFTWDDTDAGIRANAVYNYDDEGNYVSGVYSYAPNGNIYISFTEDGNLSFDHTVVYTSEDGDYFLSEASTSEAGGTEENILDQFAGKYLFTGSNPSCQEDALAPAANYQCEITVSGDELHMTGFLGDVDDDNTPYYTGTYNEVLGTIYFKCVDADNGCYVVDPATGIYYYIYDFTLTVGENEAGHITLSRDGVFNFYAYGSDWVTASYSSLLFEKDGVLPDEPEDPVDLSFFDGTYTFTGTGAQSDYTPATPADTYQCTITSEGGKLYMTGLLGTVDSNGQNPYYVGTYNEEAGTAYFTCSSYNGGYVYDGEIWYYVYDFTVNVEVKDGKVASMSTDQPFYFYSYDDDGNYYNASYATMNFVRNNGEDAISAVQDNKSAARYYDLSGRQISKPQGLYLEQSNGKVIKRLAK